MPDFTLILIALCAASLPTAYVLWVGLWIKNDLADTAIIALEPGQTDHTALNETHVAAPMPEFSKRAEPAPEFWNGTAVGA
jgi:hypothetical protein